MIYEPRADPATGNADGLHSVAALGDRGRFAGFKVLSRFAGRTVTQLILVPPAADVEFSDPALNLAFRGRFAVITIDDRDKVASLYVGDGTSLRFRGHGLTTPSAAYADLAGSSPSITASSPSTVVLPDGRRLASRPP